jgi:hypothetical protein
MARDGEHFFMCVLAIRISSFEKVLFSSVAHFFIGSLIVRECKEFFLEGDLVSLLCNNKLVRWFLKSFLVAFIKLI